MTAKTISSSPHRHAGTSVRLLMQRVCLALVPGLLCYVWFFGWGIVMQCILAVSFALGIEWVILKIRKADLSLYLKDGSAVVTGLLFALTISPLTAWWISLVGIAFAIIVAKHIYGGLGNNLFNPAMAGYVFILLCFPAQMNTWPESPAIPGEGIGFIEYIYAVFNSPDFSGDGVTGATPLMQMKSQLSGMSMVSEIMTDPIYGNIGGAGWEWISIAYLAGGIALIISGVIRWRIPGALLGSLFIMSMIFNIYDADIYASPMFHLFSGGTMLCAFFIATDPVSASTTPRGQLVYGCLIGLLAYIIRVWGAYPDGLAFAILIANAAVPFIDQTTRPRVLGEK